MADVLTAEEIIRKLELNAENLEDSGYETDRETLLEAAALIKEQAARIEELEKETRPRILSFAEVMRIYNASPRHIWPFPKPSWLWLELPPEDECDGQWTSWAAVREMIEYRHFHFSPQNYGKKWVLFTMAPSRQQRDGIPWEKNSNRPIRLI